MTKVQEKLTVYWGRIFMRSRIIKSGAKVVPRSALFALVIMRGDSKKL
jgi:hypothetical protein